MAEKGPEKKEKTPADKRAAETGGGLHNLFFTGMSGVAMFTGFPMLSALFGAGALFGTMPADTDGPFAKKVKGIVEKW